MDETSMGGPCTCKHHLVLPLLVFLFGATFLLGMGGFLSPAFVNWAWPTYITLAGIVMFFGGRCKCCCGK